MAVLSKIEMIWVDLLLWYDQVLGYWNIKKEEWKEWGRYLLGPSPIQECIVFANDDVIPASRIHHLPENAMVYSIQDITLKSHDSTKIQKLPWLSLQCKVGDEVHDYSDWLGDIKAYGIPTLLSMVRLAALVHNTYIPEEHCKIDVICRDGSEETYVFRGKRQLTKELPIRHRVTMPYDGDKTDVQANDSIWFFHET